MTRKLLIAIALLIALTPFLGISYSTQVIVTTALALFSAITLFFSRKPRMRAVPAITTTAGDITSPFSTQDFAVTQTQPPFSDSVQEMSVLHDTTEHSTPISRGSTADVGVMVAELPTHPIAPRPRRRKVTAPTPDMVYESGHEAVHGSSHEQVVISHQSSTSSFEPVRLNFPANPARVRRTPRAKSILADEEPIRPADAVIPAMELAREHAGVYGVSSHN